MKIFFALANFLNAFDLSAVAKLTRTRIKTFILLLFQGVAVFPLFGQGYIHFGNSSSTLISVNGNPMPVDQTFIFGIFFAPSTTVSAAGQLSFFFDSRFTFGGYATNSSFATGRLVTQLFKQVPFTPGTYVDFMIRGWSVQYGYTWEEASANVATYPIDFAPFGYSTIGNDLLIGDGVNIPTSVVMSPFFMEGFNMGQIPEPSSAAMVYLSIGFVLGKRISGRARQRA